MEKKTSLNGIVYFIGMLAAAIGFMLPIFNASATIFGKNVFSSAISGFDIVGDGNSTMKIMALLVFIGAAAGAVLFFLPGLKNVRILKLIALLISIAGGVYCFLNTSDFGIKLAMKFISVGFYIIIAGWLIAFAGWILNK